MYKSPLQGILNRQKNNQFLKLSGIFVQLEKIENQVILDHTFSHKIIDGNGTILDGNNNSVRILKIDGTEDVEIRNIIFKNGNTCLINTISQNAISFHSKKVSIFEYIDGAGALITNQSSVTFVDCIFENNKSIMCGGGVSIQGKSKVVFKKCTFINNSAGHTGAAIDTLSPESELIVEDSTFDNNRSNLWNKNGGPHGQVSVFPDTKASITNSNFKGECIPIDYQEGSNLKVDNNNYKSLKFNKEQLSNKGHIDLLTYFLTVVKLYPIFFKTFTKIRYRIE